MTAEPGVGAVPRLFHIAAALAVIAMVTLARTNQPAYEHLVQEDRFVEWLTVAFFLAAAAVGAARAIRARSLFDGLVALFCVAAAGEEVSWGQRFIGFTPPDVFLANNAQQEANLHNLFEAFGQPKWTLIALLAAYGVALPLSCRIRSTRQITQRLRVSAPPWALVPWYAVAIALLIAYPVRFTGEWVEAIAGALFFFSLRPTSRVALIGAVSCAIAAFAADRAAGAWVPPSARAPALVSCALAEAAAFRQMLGTHVPHLARDRTHRRVWSLWKAEGRSEFLPAFETTEPASCGGESVAEAVRRRRYAIDPWGSAYWVRVTSDAVTVYSFGPNRRRHVGPGSTGDDIVSGAPPR